MEQFAELIMLMFNKQERLLFAKVEIRHMHRYHIIC